MNAQTSRSRAGRLHSRWTPVVLLGQFVALALLLSSCVTSGDNEGTPDDEGTSSPTTQSESPTSSGKPVVASTTTSSTEADGDLRINIHSLKRQENETVVLEFSMVNTGSTDNIIVLKPPQDGDAAADIQPFSLIDGINQKKHLPLLYSNGECYCSDWSENSLTTGESVSGWIAFPAPPPDVKAMILASSIAPPILDIPIIGGSDKLPHPASEELAQAKIWDIRSLDEDLKEDTVRQESGDEVAISLSTDILFDVGESKLTDEAQGKLKQVALEIENSSGKSVDIDGHTDDTGNDSINNPLSKDRARAVEESLSSMMKNPGITFHVEGHGSSQPIATNETDEGREKNRRVTITFAK